MASPIVYLITMEENDYAERLFRWFAVSVRARKLKDTESSVGENEVTELFLTWCEAMKHLCYGLCQSVGRFSVLRYSIHHERKKRRFFTAQRTKCLESREGPNETIIQYAQRLNEASRYCKFMNEFGSKVYRRRANCTRIDRRNVWHLEQA